MGNEMPNRLATETSPYLRQHAENPVDWYPWGPEALGRARREDKPILLSIGYAACHWCHVMAHESFEDPVTAQVMNDEFVSIKVDREERPDVDSVYMQAVQSMTGHGGWPMTMFLTPAGEPFYAGTYFPPQDRHGMPSFTRVLRSVADAYRSKRDRIEQTAAAMREIYAAAGARLTASGALGPDTFDRAYQSLAAQYDPRHGGFNGAPKFPPTMSLEFLLTYAARTEAGTAADMAAETFRRMARGGIYDQIGGGFHRYSVDEAWLVPHFEKMLYDNALLVAFGVHLWQATQDAEVRRVVEATLDWVQREMTDTDGGFFASLDADSEGEEGRFYLWDESEIDLALGPDSAVFKTYFGVTPAGNFEGRTILHVDADPSVVAKRVGVPAGVLTAALARAREVILARRASRVRPARDEKKLAAWNGLMLRASALAARALGRPPDLDLAVANAEFLHRVLVQPDGRVMRTHTHGVTKIPGYLDDHAAVALGFLATYELTFDRVWLDRARTIGDAIGTWFWDEDTHGFFDTARDADPLITRPRDITDNAVPSGTSLAVELYLRLAELVGAPELHSRATRVLEAVAEPMARYPTAFGHILADADRAVYGAVTVAIVGDPGSSAFRALAAAAAPRFVPALVLAGGTPADVGELSVLGTRLPDNRSATAYLCRHRVCEAPQSDAAGLAAQLEALALHTGDQSHA
jgi:uncharacterized protein YyaL (SSP411 family)